MAGIVGIRDSLSADVVTRLATAGYPPLVDGRILLGRQHVDEQSYAPKIVMIPMASRFGPKDVTNRSLAPRGVTQTPQSQSAETHAQWAQRSRMTDFQQWEVHFWGVSTTPDPDNDFDATQTLRDVFIGALQDQARGHFALHGGTWPDQQSGATQLMKAGHYFVLSLEIGTPVLDTLFTLIPVSSMQETVVFAGNSSPSDSIVVTVP